MEQRIVWTPARKQAFPLSLYSLDPEIHDYIYNSTSKQELFFSLFMSDTYLRTNHWIRQDYLGTFPSWIHFDTIVTLCIQTDPIFSIRRLSAEYLLQSPRKVKLGLQAHRSVLHHLPLRYQLDIKFVMISLYCDKGSLRKCYRRLPTKMKKNQYVCKAIKTLDDSIHVYHIFDKELNLVSTPPKKVSEL
ncbi:MAG: hypothetical protein EOP45_10595 [Sphingobacteriaceae bacterium]|nr:MAG: hypothetical protein EOP45_10595 [Sphingobacteriaceae bacterium]